MRRKKLSSEELYERVMTSDGHAQIFYGLVLKPSYHEELTKRFNLGLGTISDRIANLLKVGLIKKVEKKEGRKQYYEVDWDGFYLIYKKESFKKYADDWMLEIDYETSAKLEIVMESPTFRNFIQAWTKTEAYLQMQNISFERRRKGRFKSPTTIRQFINQTNLFIVRYPQDSLSNPELKHLFKTFKKVIGYSEISSGLFKWIIDEVDKNVKLDDNTIEKTIIAYAKHTSKLIYEILKKK